MTSQSYILRESRLTAACTTRVRVTTAAAATAAASAASHWVEMRVTISRRNCPLDRAYIVTDDINYFRVWLYFGPDSFRLTHVYRLHCKCGLVTAEVPVSFQISKGKKIAIRHFARYKIIFQCTVSYEKCRAESEKAP